VRVKTARRGSPTRHIIIEGNHDDQGAADLHSVPILNEAVAQGEEVYNTLAQMDYRVFRIVARHFVGWAEVVGIVNRTGAWPGQLRIANDLPAAPARAGRRNGE
jgi:hypothetical protein